jgi:hypothetical protein
MGPAAAIGNDHTRSTTNSRKPLDQLNSQIEGIDSRKLFGKPDLALPFSAHIDMIIFGASLE